MYLTDDGTIACRIVLYGPPGSGKSSNLQAIHSVVDGRTKGRLQEQDLAGERSIGFTLLSGPELDIEGRPVEFTFAALPGQTRFTAARRELLANTDGILFVADSRRQALDDNIDAMNELLEHLRSHQLPADLPMVIQYNHRDQSTSIPPEQLDPLLNHRMAPAIEAVATQGKGVTESFTALGEILLQEAAQALPTLPTVSPEPEPAPGGWLLGCWNCGAMLEVDSANPGELFACGSCGSALEVVDAETGRTRAPIASNPGTSNPGEETYAFQAPAASQPALTPEENAPPQAVANAAFTLPGFELVRELDESALGQRFQVREIERNRELRAFVPADDVMGLPGFRQQLEPYVRMASRVQHPNILPLVGLRWQGHTAVILSQSAVSFEPLNMILARRRQLQTSQAIDIIRQLALGLEEASRHGVVHGFLRPEVVLVSGDGRVVLDGLAMPKNHNHLIQASTGNVDTTEYYLAPEHLLVDAPSDVRSDFFMLGALLHRMVTGSGMVTGYSAVEALHRYTATGTGSLAGMESGSAMPRELDGLFTRLTSVERRDRFQQYGELLDQIDRLLSALERGPLRNTGTGRRSTGTARRGTAGNRRTTANIRRGTASPSSTGVITGGTGPISTGTGTGPIRTPSGSKRYGTGQLPKPQTRRHGTGQLPPPTTRRHGTGQLPGPTTRRHGTGPIAVTGTQRRTANHQRGRTGDDSSNRRRRKSGGGGIVWVVVLLAAVGVAILVVAMVQPRASISTTTAGGGSNSSGSSATGSGGDQVDRRTPTQIAEAALIAYEKDRSEANLTAARESLTALSGPLRASYNNRLRKLQDKADGQTTPPTGGDATNTAETNPDTATDTGGGAEPANDGTEKPVEIRPLTASEKKAITDLIREQRFAEAQGLIDETVTDPAVKEFYLGDIDRNYNQAKSGIEKAVSDASDVARVERLLSPVQRWGMDGDEDWAAQLLADAKERLPAVADTGGDIVEIDPDTPPTSGTNGQATDPTTTQSSDDGTSPGGFSLASLQVFGELDRALRNDLVPNMVQILSPLEPTSDEFAALTLHGELWDRRREALDRAVAAGDRKLRVSNPITNGLSDVTGTHELGVQLTDPGGSVTEVNWQEINDEDLAKLFKEVVQSTGSKPVDLAVAASVNLVIGHQVSATIHSKSARSAGYENIDDLDRLVAMAKDRELVDLFNQGRQAGQQNDIAGIDAVIAELSKGSTAKEPAAQSVVAELTELKEAIARGERPAGALADNLTYEDANDRLAFPNRQGWLLAEGRYTSINASSSISRQDLGNASSLTMTYLLNELQGGFRVDFRGVEVVADIVANRILVRSPGRGNESEIPLTFAANTVYTLTFDYDRDSGGMTVGLNRLQPVTINVGQPTTTLSIITDTSAALAIEEIRIKRYGSGEEAAAEEDLASLQEGQDALRGLGLVPIGRATKAPDGPAIKLPAPRDRRSGIAVPLLPTDKGLRFQANGTGKLMIRLGTIDNGAENGSFKTVSLPAADAAPATVSVTFDGTNYSLNVVYPDAGPTILDEAIPEGADHLIILAEDSATILQTPEAIR